MTPKSAAGLLDEVVLAEGDDYTLCEEFKYKSIYRRIADNWSREKYGAGLQDLQTTWNEYVERKFKVHPEYENAVAKLLTEFRSIRVAEDDASRAKETARIRRYISEYRPYIIDSSSANINCKDLKPVHHKKLLPNTVATQLVSMKGWTPIAV
jgi:hypothetical protein